MNLRQLECLVMVAEEQHFGRAARRLHVSQPALSQQIKALEAELELPLFHRTTRRVGLTPAGEAMVERARGILDDVVQAQAEAQRVHRGEAGRIGMSFVGSATYALLPSVVQAVRQAVPGVHLAIESEQLTPMQEEALLSGRSDVAVLTLTPRTRVSPLLAVEPLRSLGLVVAVATNHRWARRKRLRCAELASEPFLVHPSGGRSILHLEVLALCREAGFAPRVAQEVRETVTAVSLAAAGMGIAVLPDAVRHLRLPGATYVPLAGTDARIQQALAFQRNDPNPTLQRVLTVIRAACAPEA